MHRLQCFHPTCGVWCPALPVSGVERAAQPGAMGAPSYVQPDRWDQTAHQQPNACGPLCSRVHLPFFLPIPKYLNQQTLGGEMKAAGSPIHLIILHHERRTRRLSRVICPNENFLQHKSNLNLTSNSGPFCRDCCTQPNTFIVPYKCSLFHFNGNVFHICLCMQRVLCFHAQAQILMGRRTRRFKNPIFYASSVFFPIPFSQTSNVFFFFIII